MSRFTISCFACGCVLDPVTIVWDKEDERLTVEIEPCSQCRAEARKAGEADGYIKGGAEFR